MPGSAAASAIKLALPFERVRESDSVDRSGFLGVPVENSGSISTYEEAQDEWPVCTFQKLNTSGKNEQYVRIQLRSVKVSRTLLTLASVTRKCRTGKFPQSLDLLYSRQHCVVRLTWMA